MASGEFSWSPPAVCQQLGTNIVRWHWKNNTSSALDVRGIHQINDRLSAAVRGGADSAAPTECVGTALASQLMLPAAKTVTSVYDAKN